MLENIRCFSIKNSIENRDKLTTQGILKTAALLIRSIKIAKAF